MIILVIVGLAVVTVGLMMLILKIWRPAEVLGWLLCFGAPLLTIEVWVEQPIPLPDIDSLFGMLYALIIVTWIAAMIYHAYLPDREQKTKRKGILIRRSFSGDVQTANRLHDDDNPFIDLRFAPESDSGKQSTLTGGNQP
jgi:hypothetical protein